jgi:hypothetical protein
VFVNKTYDPTEIEELGFFLEDDVVKEKIGEETIVVPETDKRLVKAVKTKVNWVLLGPAVAVMLFVFSWGGVISEKAYTASANVENIEKLDKKFIKQNDRITSITKANERQEILIKEQMQVLKRQDEVMVVHEKYMNKLIDRVDRSVVDELRLLRITIEELRLEIRALKRK